MGVLDAENDIDGQLVMDYDPSGESLSASLGKMLTAQSCLWYSTTSKGMQTLGDVFREIGYGAQRWHAHGHEPSN
jgi:hypothetical protein